ncbi:MAG: hypothetical protein ABIN89_16740 [Chitinophagaceae bacterium]
MNRRKFVTMGAASACLLPLAGAASYLPVYGPQAPPGKPGWLLQLIKLNDGDLKGMSALKIADPKHALYGGYQSVVEIPNPVSTCGYIFRACAAIATPESVYYQSKAVLNNISIALQSLLKMQHSDGTIDLLETNFHSPPDTAFMVKRLMQAYNIFMQADIPGKETAKPFFEQFLKRAGEALITGGIHTPNHRWVVSAALTKLNERWPDPRYINRINDWLAEKIDLDADGQYTEKSTYGYSAVVDRVLITVAKGVNKPELLDAVRKNLLMMRYYLHPNGEVVTEASSRQDKGQVGTMENYYYACRFMALIDNDGEMAAMCRIIENTSLPKLTDTMNYFLEDPSLWKELPGSKPLPVSYVKSFPFSGVVRIRRNQWDATILANNPGWFTFHKTNAVLQAMRIAASFFGKGQFQAETVEQVGDKWVLTRKLEGPYFQPFPKDKIPGDGDMAKMPKSQRQQSNVQYLETIVTISEANNGISVDIDVKGTDGVPVSMELVFRPGGIFNGVQAHHTEKDAWLFSGEKGGYTVNGNTLQFGPGKMLHKGIHLRGALPPMDAPTVYLTGFTPFKHTIFLS